MVNYPRKMLTYQGFANIMGVSNLEFLEITRKLLQEVLDKECKTIF
jgi:hypothetical protein